jgi:hypothetical protein
VLVASRAFRPIQRVLVAFDGGPSAMKAVAHIAGDRLLRGLPMPGISTRKKMIANI